jgi:hypothetical protein
MQLLSKLTDCFLYPACALATRGMLFAQAEYAIFIYDVFMRTSVFLEYHAAGSDRGYWAPQVQALFGDELECVGPRIALVHVPRRTRS